MGLPDPSQLGEPDLSVAGFQLWIHDQPHAGCGEPYDEDWLTVTAHCGAAGASVWATGAIATISGIDQLRRESDQIHTELRGAAYLASPEPNLAVTLEATDSRGHVLMTVEITPNHMTQEHRFEFELDQTFLFDLTRQCDDILVRYPNPHDSSRSRSNDRCS